MHRTDLYLRASHLPQVRDEHGLSIRASTSYLVKCWLGELFGEEKPSSWRMQEQGELVKVSAYTGIDADALQAHAQVVAPPSKYSACEWDRAASKPVPSYEGLYVYRIHACPAVQKSSGGSGRTLDDKTFTWSAGDELDVFLSEIAKGNEQDSRETIYTKWLRDQFKMDQHDWGAKIRSARVDQWRLSTTTVRTGGVRHIKRPEVLFSGRIDVHDPECFARTLARGLGKLKAFGHGMIDIVDVA